MSQGSNQSISSAVIRSRAARAVAAVIRDNRTTDWLQEYRPEWITHPLSRALTYGALRHYFGLAELVDNHLKKPLKSKDLDIYALLLVGAYQLKLLNTPDHAVINETVSAASKLRKPWAKGLVNAVLRNINATEQSLDSTSIFSPVFRELLENQSSTASLLPELSQACQLRAPMWLRISVSQVSVERYLLALTDQGVSFSQPFPNELPETIRLHEPMSAINLPGWDKGWVSVQDIGAQFACLLTHPQKQKRILDACAAPGGKLFHLLDRLHDPGYTDKDIEVDALEINPSRAAYLNTEASRLGHTIRILKGDATSDNWWDHSLYDTILVDAPCSGTGTTRRHPDLQILLQTQDIPKHAQLQANLLNNLWPKLKIGGTLLYSTCSILELENDQVVTNFRDQNPDAALLSVELPRGKATQCGWQTTPIDDCDGFYYALLMRTPPNPLEIHQEQISR